MTDQPDRSLAAQRSSWDLDHWLNYIGGIHPVGWDLGLERVAEVGQRLELLHPSETVILVAGTNGKGSTCEYLEQLAISNNLRVGKSTSPHLYRFNERIAINGEPASDQQIITAFEQIDDSRGDLTLTYFEFATLASLLIFKQQKVDVSVLEIGLGGRLDAMNIVAPDLSIITSISLDHQEYLGDTRDAIAREKAGIMRADVPCLIADREPPDSLFEVATELGTPVVLIGTDFEVSRELSPKLPADSFAVALEAARVLDWHTDSIAGIVAQTELPGRRSWRQLHCDVLLDVAHNPAAARSLAEYLADLDQYREIHAVLGMYADKDIEAVTGFIGPLIKTWHLVASDEARAASPEELEARLSVDKSGNVTTYDKIDRAFAGATADAGEDDLILVFGSFPIVGRCLELLPEQH